MRTPVMVVIGIPGIAFGFVAGGWKVGLLNILLGMILGTIALRIAYVLHSK